MDNTRIVDLDQFSELQEAEHIGNETVDSVEEDEGETLDSEGKQPKTESEKVRGNEAFQEGDYQKAVEHWLRGLRTCRYIISKSVYSGSDKIYIDDLAKTLSLNLALGNIKLGKCADSIRYSDAVLETDPQNMKALFRKATAQFMVDDYEPCLDTVSLMLDIEAGNPAAKQLQAKATRELMMYNSRQRRMMSNVFRNLEPDPRVEESGLMPWWWCVDYVQNFPTRVINASWWGMRIIHQKVSTLLNRGTLYSICRACSRRNDHERIE